MRFTAFAFDGWGEDTWWTFCDELIDGRQTTLAQVLSRGRYDLLHCIASTYSPPYDVEKWVRRARFRGPIVLMSQMAQRELTQAAHATVYVAPATDSAAILEADASAPVRIVPNGYDEEVFRPATSAPGERPLLVWVGRSWDPQKGIDLFLDALEALEDYEAAIVDETADPVTIEDRLEGLRPRVRHLPRLAPRELADVYRSAAASGGAYLSTSRHEGFPIAPAEALGCGCPVVAPRASGFTHLTDGVNAVLYDRDGGVEAVAQALARLREPDFRHAVAEGGRRRAEQHWTSRAMAGAYLELYADALKMSMPQTRVARLHDSAVRAGWQAALAFRPLWRRFRYARRPNTRVPAAPGSDARS